MGRTAFGAVAVVVGIGCWSACGGEIDGSEPSRGGVQQLCFANGTCSGDLVCSAGRCVTKGSGAGPGAGPGAGGSSTSSNGSVGTTSSSGVIDGQLDPSPCEFQKKCFPNTYAAEFADDNECSVVYGSMPNTALEGSDPECGPGFICGELTPECSKGTLLLGKKCITGGQCASGICSGFTGVACGACGDEKKEGDPCGATDFVCGGDLRCDFAASKCVKALGIDEDCSGAAAGSCRQGLVCKSTNKCATPGQIGDACAFLAGTTISVECRGGLSCKDGKCADVAPKFIRPDGPCEPVNYATERCTTGFACDATAKKCTKPSTTAIDCRN